MSRICMIDIETLGLKPTSKILSLGATVVPTTSSEYFYCEFSLDGQENRTTDKSTIDWWSTQHNFPRGTVPLDVGLREFTYWFIEKKFTEIWCRGLDFDVPIIVNALDQHNIQIPWKYYDVRDLRTLTKIFPNIVPTFPQIQQNKHNALHDAVYQAEHLTRILNYINRGDTI